MDTRAPPATHALLTVFFCGTAGQVGPPHSTQIGLFASATLGLDIRGNSEDFLAAAVQEHQRRGAPLHFTMAFDGIGVVNGCAGTLFASGLCLQVSEVVRRVASFAALGIPLQINAVGLSRGGMAVLYLLRHLARDRATRSLDQSQCLVRACLFDPVPGNTIWVSSLLRNGLRLGVSTANQCLDVSQSPHCADILAIYPHELLPDLAFHAPIVPRYPVDCAVDEDATLGCHQGALFHPTDALDSCLSFARIHRWLTDRGTTLNFFDAHGRHPGWFTASFPGLEGLGSDERPGARCDSLEDVEQLCLRALDRVCAERRRSAAGGRAGVGNGGGLSGRGGGLFMSNTVRRAHGTTCSTIVAEASGEWLNRHHKQLYARWGGGRRRGDRGASGAAAGRSTALCVSAAAAVGGEVGEGGEEDPLEQKQDLLIGVGGTGAAPPLMHAVGGGGRGGGQFMLYVDRRAACYFPLCAVVCCVLLLVVVALPILNAKGVL